MNRDGSKAALGEQKKRLPQAVVPFHQDVVEEWDHAQSAHHTKNSRFFRGECSHRIDEYQHVSNRDQIYKSRLRIFSKGRSVPL